ncbi:MAG: 3-phosphoshikimate 1-carboxyvinyltransferase [Firmicutes bacterium]|nr:3-phosphoshikimate 1-carboxyvinyltransferase [Bacillota bacterium]
MVFGQGRGVTCSTKGVSIICGVAISSILPFKATLRMPPDKSISHRALLFGAIACGTSELVNVSSAQDVLSTKHCLEQLGVVFGMAEGRTMVYSEGVGGFCEPENPLDCGNSGTTMRLLTGILTGSGIKATLSGDQSLMRRPMQRVVRPLLAMGGSINTAAGLPPITIQGRPLQGKLWRPEVASAQVKSAILLAGLFARGVTRVEELHPTRDHTERMLQACGGKVQFGPGWAEVAASRLSPMHFRVPGDVSAAAFFVVLAACLPGATLHVAEVGLNPGRIGFLEVLRLMGADVSWTVDTVLPEPSGSIVVRGGTLRPFSIAGEMVPRLIDELPVLAVAAACAHGRSEVRDAGELRVKESDRIAALLTELNKLGVKTEEFPDGFAIIGGKMQGAEVCSHEDHRLAMALAVAGSLASGITTIKQAGCVRVSYPGFWGDLAKIQGGEEN